MKAMLIISGVIILALFSINTAFAAIINVPGDYPTIQQGINASGYNDTVLVANGTYSENLTILSNPLTLASNYITSGDTADIANTIIDGGNSTSTITIDPNSPIQVNVIGFAITNGLGTGNWPNVHGGGIHIGDAVTVLIDHCYIYNNSTTGTSNRGGGIYINSSNSRISNCVFYNNESRFGPAIAVGNETGDTMIDSCVMYNNICTDSNPDNMSAISITYSYDITVSHCLIHHNNGTGIRNWGSYITNVVNCTISNNGAYGIYNSYYNSNIYVQNTIVAHNSLMSLFNNDVYSPISLCEYSDMTGGNGLPWFGEGCIDTDPMFSDTLSHDYSLAPGSPCIDTGDPDSPLDPDGTTCDMGAICRMATGVDGDNVALPENPALVGNYPNPFNAATTIKILLAESGEAELSIYNTLGQKVATLLSGNYQRGDYSLTWNASEFPSGIYFARLEAGGIIHNLKMVLLK